MKLPICALVLVGASGSLFAAEATNSAPTQSETKAYTDGGTTTSTVTSYSPSYSPSYSSSWDRSSYGGFSGGYSSGYVTTQYRPLYYAPNPPALGQLGFRTRSSTDLNKFAPPLGLASHVYELFFTPLSTLLFTEDLSKKRREKLDAYQAARSGLIAEIRTKLDSLQGANAATRESELAALATTQSTRLAALEVAAEELRYNYVEGGFFQSNSDWNDSRRWRLGDDTRWESQLDEIKVMRGYAAYQHGLSTEQRYLLRELAMELEDSMAAPTSDISLTSQGPYFYFSPATARITLPIDIPDTVETQISRYRELKSGLKQELRDTLYANDRALFNSKRVSALKALAEKQASGFVELDRLAEDIRRSLAPLPNPARPPALPLSNELRTRVTNYHRQKAALQTALLSKLDEVRATLSTDRVEFTRVGDSYNVTVIPNRRASAEQIAKREAIVAALKSFNQEHSQKYSALTREKTALARDVLSAVGDLSGRNTTKSLNQLLQEFNFSLQKQEIWELYRDYEIAALEPGLSPAQRRIFFGVAIDKLNLPLNN
ncbi:hypothetical protein [Oleiharenicola lentus]|uniref:hypothetical protein n=1 Tax=Oleiharenicola lentus TaxID=2508720 RepID=UPI003F66883E